MKGRLRSSSAHEVAQFGSSFTILYYRNSDNNNIIRCLSFLSIIFTSFLYKIYSHDHEMDKKPVTRQQYGHVAHVYTKSGLRTSDNPLSSSFQLDLNNSCNLYITINNC